MYNSLYGGGMNTNRRAIEILERIEMAYMNVGRGQAYAEIAAMLAALESRIAELESFLRDGNRTVGH